MRKSGFLVESLKSDPIRYDVISKYDVFVIAAPFTPPRLPTDSEINDIVRYVNEGGGLLLLALGWSWVSYTNLSIEVPPTNLIGSRFGITINDDVIYDPTDNIGETHIPIFHFISHPVTVGLKEICMEVPSSLTVSSGAKTIVQGDDDSYAKSGNSYTYPKGSHPPFVAVAESGSGRVVYVAHDGIFTSSWLRRCDNLKLAMNVFEWLNKGAKEAQGILQHFDLDYRDSPPNSDGNDQHSITVNAGATLTLFFYYREGNAGNNYIIRVYPEWDKDHFIANSDNDESSPEEDGKEIGGFRWDKEAYTVPSISGTYKIRVVYSASTRPPTWDSYDRLLAEGIVIVQAAPSPTNTVYITKLVPTTTTVYRTMTIEETYVSAVVSERTITEQITLTLEKWYTITHTVALTAQPSNIISIILLAISILIFVISLYLILVGRRREIMKESYPAKALTTDDLLRKAKLIELDRLRAEEKSAKKHIGD